MSGRGGWSLQEVGLHPRRHQTFGRNLGGSTSATTSCRMAVGGVELELLVVYIYIYIYLSIFPIEKNASELVCQHLPTTWDGEIPMAGRTGQPF